MDTKAVQAFALINQLTLPEQDLKKLSFCSSNKVTKVVDWANNLRPTQYTQTSALLYKALPELNRLKTSAQNRFEMLEALRPYVQSTITSLSKMFLQQPLSLPAEAQKSAIIAQALQKHMIDGYSIVVRDSLGNYKPKQAISDVLSTAIHRAITGFGLMFMRSFQLYSQTPKGSWLSLHTLFRIADSLSALDTRVADDIQNYVKVSTIQTTYLQSILLASSKPHQLSQNDVRAIYDAFGEWAEYVRFVIDLSDDPECFYYVNLDRDAGPLYKSRRGIDEEKNLKIELNLKPLLSQLSKQTGNVPEDAGASSLKVPSDVNKAALLHLLETWGSVAQRQRERKPISITADVAIGLSECHYFLCNGIEFERFTQGAGSASVPNSVGSGFTPKDSAEQKSATRPLARVEVQNISHGGCCLLWRSESPLKVQSGDVIGVKEMGKRAWAIGVVRWIRQRKLSSQLGVQILSDKALPWAIAQNFDMGGHADYMRALFLPGSELDGSSDSVITPSASFQAMDRVKMLDGDDLFEAKLDEQLFSTGAVQQLSFRRLSNSQSEQKKSAKSGW